MIYNQLVYSYLALNQSVRSNQTHLIASSELIVGQSIQVSPRHLYANSILHLVQDLTNSFGDRELSVGNTLVISQSLNSPKDVRSVLSLSYSVSVTKAKWLKNSLTLSQSLTVYKTKRVVPSKLNVRQTVVVKGTRNKTVSSTLVIRQTADIYIRKVNKPKRVLNPC